MLFLNLHYKSTAEQYFNIILNIMLKIHINSYKFILHKKFQKINPSNI